MKNTKATMKRKADESDEYQFQRSSHKAKKKIDDMIKVIKNKAESIGGEELMKEIKDIENSFYPDKNNIEEEEPETVMIRLLCQNLALVYMRQAILSCGERKLKKTFLKLRETMSIIDSIDFFP